MCFEACSNAVSPTICRQAVFDKPSGACYMMTESNVADQDGIGGSTARWKAPVFAALQLATIPSAEDDSCFRAALHTQEEPRGHAACPHAACPFHAIQHAGSNTNYVSIWCAGPVEVRGGTAQDGGLLLLDGAEARRNVAVLAALQLATTASSEGGSAPSRGGAEPCSFL